MALAECVALLLLIACATGSEIEQLCAAGNSLACQADDLYRMQQQRLQSASIGSDPNGTGPLDCHGRGCQVTGTSCHNECECRHLDSIEQSRFRTARFRYPKKPALVITASRDGRGTASTWAFNAVRLLFRQAWEACDSYWIRVLTEEKLKRRKVTGAHVVVKTHEWTQHISREAFDAMRPMFTHVVVSTREGRENDPAWMAVATMDVAFEDVVAHDTRHGTARARLVLRRLADHLGDGVWNRSSSFFSALHLFDATVSEAVHVLLDC
eukprot:TRINITY_DN50048_c0_g1_i2.p1 TRINITY_DN50048_c0_g1~~TRINITY_DN50048_c0_g1_i2.p1  ORF type:complete len:268 (+),score=17.37 TRINITY_DN50048_c0_g1_i2:2-805(+)